jgi:hypothetical protein
LSNGACTGSQRKRLRQPVLILRQPGPAEPCHPRHAHEVHKLNLFFHKSSSTDKPFLIQGGVRVFIRRDVASQCFVHVSARCYQLAEKTILEWDSPRSCVGHFRFQSSSKAAMTQSVPVRGKQNTNPTRSISTEAWGKNMKEVARSQSSCNKKSCLELHLDEIAELLRS